MSACSVKKKTKTNTHTHTHTHTHAHDKQEKPCKLKINRNRNTVLIFSQLSKLIPSQGNKYVILHDITNCLLIFTAI